MLSFLRKKMKTIMIMVAVLFAATMFYGLGYSGLKNMDRPKKDSIATINGKEIDHKRFQQILNRMFSQEKGRVSTEMAVQYQVLALDQIIQFTLMLDEAKKKFRVSGGEMDQTIQQIMQANKIPNIDVLKNTLRNMGQTYNEFKSSLKEEILISKMMGRVKGEVTVSPEDLREVKASHILIMPRGQDEKSEFEARAKAEDILQKIKGGQSFYAMAMEYSDDTETAKKGGDLGYFTTGRMVPEFEKVAFSLKPGELSGVFRSQYGYHVMLVEDTRLRKVKEKGTDISAAVLAEKQEFAVKKWIYGLQQKAKIEINEPLLKAHTLLLSGKVNEAISAYNMASMDNPSNPYIHLFLGEAYMLAKNKEAGMQEYDKAAQMSGSDANLLISLGDAYYKQNKPSLALEQYRRASLIAGDNKETHVELKKIFKDMGASSDAANEQAAINRIEKKEKFEKEIQEKLK